LESAAQFWRTRASADRTTSGEADTIVNNGWRQVVGQFMLRRGVVSERLHVGGLLLRLVQGDDSFLILTENDNTGLGWPTVEGGTVGQVKEYVDGVLRTAKHDCSELGCSNWLDHSN
jgi:hypothetical protein